MPLAGVPGIRLEVRRLDAIWTWQVDVRPALVICWAGEFMVELDPLERAYLVPGDLFTIPAMRRHRFLASEGAFAIFVEGSNSV
jgi:quercetin dioxygenase-like cupin family protein